MFTRADSRRLQPSLPSAGFALRLNGSFGHSGFVSRERSTEDESSGEQKAVAAGLTRVRHGFVPTLIQTKLGHPVKGLHEPSDEEVRSAAAEGVRTPVVTLPFLDRIQARFGRHPIGHIKAHVGSVAAKASRAMNALAFASGDHVVFRDMPDLRTAAHEAAHVIQQQAGAQLAGGVGQEGDAYERHADAVADAVAAGRSAAGLLETVFTSSLATSNHGLIQRMKVKVEGFGDCDSDDKDDVKYLLEALQDGDVKLSDVPQELLAEIGKNFEEDDFAQGLWAPLGGSQTSEAAITNEERARRNGIDQLHAQCMQHYLSEENRITLRVIKKYFQNDPDVQIVYRGQWYKGALDILRERTIGGLPRAKFADMISGEALDKVANIQKQKGGTAIKGQVNEWSTSRAVGENWGKDTVVLVALILPASDYKTADLIYQDREDSPEQGLIMDSRSPLIAVAILSIADNPSYARQSNAS